METNKIYNGLAEDLLPQIKSKSIDFVLIDPPYELDQSGSKNKNSEIGNRKINSDKHLDFVANGFDIEGVFAEIERVSKTMNLICFCSNKQISKIMGYWENKGYSTTLLVWDKPNPIPFGNGKHISNLEFMVYVRGSGVTFNSIGQNKTFIYSSPSSSKRIHPTEKPIQLLQKLIQIHTKENDIVLDCFSGSGSTGEACIVQKRNYILIEKLKEYYDLSCKRIDVLLSQQSLF